MKNYIFYINKKLSENEIVNDNDNDNEKKNDNDYKKISSSSKRIVKTKEEMFITKFINEYNEKSITIDFGKEKKLIGIFVPNNKILVDLELKTKIPFEVYKIQSHIDSNFILYSNKTAEYIVYGFEVPYTEYYFGDIHEDINCSII